MRDNEVAAGSAGIPVVRTKLMAFALSGFIAGYAGVCFAFATERFSTDTFDPTFSILVVSMVVIGGLDSIPGAMLGALYLVGLPAIFGSTPTIEFLTSGIGLMAFILYLPGGMAQVMHQLGDLATAGVEHLQARRAGARPARRTPAGAPTSTAGPGTSTQPGGGGRGDLVSRPTDAGSPPTQAPSPTPAVTRGPRPPPPDGKARPASRSTELSVAFGGLRAVDQRQRVGRAGHDRRAHRAQRVGQDDAPRHRLGARRAGRGPHHARRRGPRPTTSPRSAAALGIVRSFQDCRLYPELTVEDTLMLCEDARRRVERALDHAAAAVGPARRARQARGRRPGHRLVRPRAVPPPPHRAPLDRHAPGRRPGVHRAGPTRACCCSTSPPPASPSARPRRSSRCCADSTR